ncbi:hypothetical protein VTH06DRAFT_4987 [Thermothelomyces fergusii]
MSLCDKKTSRRERRAGRGGCCRFGNTSRNETKQPGVFAQSVLYSYGERLLRAVTPTWLCDPDFGKIGGAVLLRYSWKWKHCVEGRNGAGTARQQLRLGDFRVMGLSGATPSVSTKRVVLANQVSWT